MESIPVMIQHKGNWIEANQYADFEVIGVMIPQNSTYLDLLHIIAQEIQVNLEKQNIEIKYQVKIQYPALKISDDSSFRFYLEIKKKEIDFTMYPLCIVVISDTSQIQTILPDASASISTAISESNRDQDTISIHDRYMSDTFDEIGQYTKLLAIDTIDCNDDQNQESVSDPLQDIDLAFGKTFKDKATLQACLRLHAINNHYQQKTVKSCQKNIFVKCIDDTCQWYLKASINVHTKQFIIRKQDMNHTCPIETRFSNQKQASVSHIAASIKMKYLNVKATYTPVDIRNDMQTLHGVKISYMMAWRSRELAFEMLRGKPCESYKSLPTFLYMLGTRNPGSSIDIQLRDDSTFLYVFTALKASITGWQYCKPVIVVDATFLKETFGGTLLVATAQDAAGKLFPLAFSAVDSENDDSWHYFFTKIKQAFGTREGICIVSDRHLSIESAIKRIYPEATHGVCMFHLLNNLKTNFKRNVKKLKEPFFAAARSYTEVEFDYHMKVLDSLDARVRPFLQQIKYERWSRVHSLKNSNITCKRTAVTALFMHLHDLQQEYVKLILDSTALFYVVKPSSDDIITVLENGKKYTVNMVERTCTCKKFDIDEIPCKHAIAFLADKKIEPYAYCSRYYTNAAMLATYSDTVYPFEKEEEWIIPEHIKNMIVKPPQHRTRTGRPKKGMYQSKWGNPKNDPNQGQCGKCGHAGHNRKTCRNKPKDT
ncbi:uncharacterized protein LOC126681878 [Mercurialis annua]|uniref:uncharacterized protein LOC126681878 n=1 Tax=Mercurialis annua TaxID=3986 RepID=UPI0024ADD98D|nr:uncharacterized protein LOC126681878 [Mercurialis annua]